MNKQFAELKVIYIRIQKKYWVYTKITIVLEVGEGATAQTHSCCVKMIGTPSGVKTDQPPTPPTNTSAPRSDTDNADMPKIWKRCAT